MQIIAMLKKRMTAIRVNDKDVYWYLVHVPTDKGMASVVFKHITTNRESYPIPPSVGPVSVSVDTEKKRIGVYGYWRDDREAIAEATIYGGQFMGLLDPEE